MQLHAGDAMVVNADGSVAIGPTVAGPEILRIGGQVVADNVLSAQAPAAISTATTLTGSAFGHWFVVSGTTASYSITLPSVAGNAGRLIGFRVSDPSAASFTYTVAATASQVIDGLPTCTLRANQSLVVMCDGAQWARLVGQPPQRYLWTERFAGGIRVTVTPNQSGQWRSYRKSANSQAGTDGAPTILPQANQGFRITSVNFSSAASDATRYEIFVGPGRHVEFEFYAAAGRTGYVLAQRAQYGAGLNSTVGTEHGYDRTTGVAWVDTQSMDSTVTIRACGLVIPVNGGAFAQVNALFFDLAVTE